MLMEVRHGEVGLSASVLRSTADGCILAVSDLSARRTKTKSKGGRTLCFIAAVHRLTERHLRRSGKVCIHWTRWFMYTIRQAGGYRIAIPHHSLFPAQAAPKKRTIPRIWHPTKKITGPSMRSVC